MMWSPFCRCLFTQKLTLTSLGILCVKGMWDQAPNINPED